MPAHLATPTNRNASGARECCGHSRKALSSVRSHDGGFGTTDTDALREYMRSTRFGVLKL